MVELTWAQVHGQRHKMFDLLASMAGWVRYDEATGTGLKPPGEPSYCPLCKWDKGRPVPRTARPQARGPPAHALVRRGGGAASREPSRRVGVREPEGPSRPWADGRRHVPAGRGRPEPRTGIAGPRRRGPTRSGSARRPTGASPSACRCRPCRRTSRSSGRPAAARRGWPRCVAEEAVRLGVPVLAVDPQGDLVQFLRPAPEPPGLSAGGTGRCAREFLDRVEPRVWTPGSSHGRRLSLDPIRLAGRDELARVADPARREEEWEGMLAAAAAQLVGLAKVGGETDSQQTFLLQVLRSLAADGGGRDVDLAAIAAAVSDPDDGRPGRPGPVHQEVGAGEARPQAQRPAARPGRRPLHRRPAARPRRDVPARRPGQDAPERRLPERPGRRRPEALLRGRAGRRGLPLDGHLGRRPSRAGPACSSTSTRPATSSPRGPPSRRPRGR